jgi:two-component sensor histidine kinase
VAIVGVARDVTERKRAMDQISESLREKEVLLKEIHHRVKNNLQIISSLLSLQSEYIKDDAMLKIFKESQHRVRSMALIHEKLYQSKNLAEINFAEYIRELTMQLVRSFGLTTYGIAVQQDLENISLGIDQAIPCGIVVNELVTNALRYAFPGRQSGLIEVSLRSRPDNRIELSVKDNGVGMPPSIDLETADTLGLTLVRMLVDQLQGTVSLVSSPPGAEGGGTSCVITFTAGGRL